MRRGYGGDLSGILDGNLACGNPLSKYVKGAKKKHIREIHFEGGGRKGNYFQVVPPDVVKPNLRQPTLT